MEPIVKNDEKDIDTRIGFNSVMTDIAGENCIAARSISRKKFHAGDQWSQDENCGPDDLPSDASPLINSHSYLNPEGNCSSSTSASNCNKQCFSQNNNLIIDKSNLRCPDEKSYCCYLKFPIKVNNNIYPDKSGMRDGMEDYFEQHSAPDSQNKISCSTTSKCNGSELESSLVSHVNDMRESRIPSYPDQINALNGEEDDEDNGCIYTYKGDNYEANLSHLIETCFSCGLPTSEQSGSQHGAVSIQRILNGSMQPNPKPQSNLYSPDMDFLEMDFDPGSAGDGGDSDCEDNSILNVDHKALEDNSLEQFASLNPKTEKKSNNIPNEIRSLMCRRCEMCIFNEQKVNNTSNSFMQRLNAESVIEKNVPDAMEKETPQQSLNVQFGPSDRSIVNDNSHFMHDSEQLFVDMKTEMTDQHFENNLNADYHPFSEDFSGDEADDEGGDDSISEQPPSGVSCEQRRVSSNSLFFPSSNDLPNGDDINSSDDLLCNISASPRKPNKQIRFSNDTCNYSDLSSHNEKFCADILSRSSKNTDSRLVCNTVRDTEYRNSSDMSEKIYSENNNLGSVSAPEVSPSKEYSPLEKFSRSISFHNQLSSPKYENVCFSHPYKDNFFSNVTKYHTAANSNEYCTCKLRSSSCSYCQNSETSNLEACVDRLNQREKSVFNITSASSSSPQHTKSPSRCLNQPNVKLFNSVASTNEISSSSSHPQEMQNISGSCVYANSVESEVTIDGANNVRETQNMRLPLTLPVKTLHSKVDDPSKDPNTASEGDLEPDQNGWPSKSSVVEKIMIWTERQATFRQVSQVGTSACGATAVINVLLALDHPRPVKAVTAAIRTRLRAENSQLVEYLLSRSNAGTAHDDLLRGVETISEGAVTGRFFHMFPKRAFQFSRWLIHWIKKGGVPVATLNLQVGVSPGQTIPDAWHHQMVFGVGPQGIYLTNPLECVSDSLLSDQLCSDSVLLVRRADIESRWDQNDKLINLSLQMDPRWNEMNVLGQVVCVLKEQAAPEMLQGRRHLTSHVAIPACYKSGVTIFMRADNPCKLELQQAPELPLLDE